MTLSTIASIFSPQVSSMIQKPAINEPIPTPKPQPTPQPTPQPPPKPAVKPAPKPKINIDHLTRLKQIFKLMIQTSFKTIPEAIRTASKNNLVFDKVLSNEDKYVYLDRLTGFALVTHRGSSTVVDWLVSDVLIITGLSSIYLPRLSEATRITRAVEEKYGPSDSFGFSLGGYVAERTNASGYILTYNKASNLNSIQQQTNDKQIDYRTKKDLVSFLSETQKTNIKYVGDDVSLLNAHSSDNLDDIQKRRV